MSIFLMEMESRLALLKQAERELEILQRFRADGGAHRMHMLVEHRDDEVRETVTRIINETMPRVSALDIMITAAAKRAADLQDAITTAAMSVSIDKMGGVA